MQRLCSQKFPVLQLSARPGTTRPGTTRPGTTRPGTTRPGTPMAQHSTILRLAGVTTPDVSIGWP